MAGSNWAGGLWRRLFCVWGLLFPFFWSYTQFEAQKNAPGTPIWRPKWPILTEPGAAGYTLFIISRVVFSIGANLKKVWNLSWKDFNFVFECKLNACGNLWVHLAKIVESLPLCLFFSSEPFTKVGIEKIDKNKVSSGTYCQRNAQWILPCTCMNFAHRHCGSLLCFVDIWPKNIYLCLQNRSMRF